MNAETPLSPDVEKPAVAAQDQRKPRVALMGEFSAGKSTLANVLLGTAPLPVKITATRLPPVWISDGPEGAVVVDPDGRETPVERAGLADIPFEEGQLIRLTQHAPILELCDLIDMPGISDPNMPPSVWQALVTEIDHVIWCTHATQAWRQSEAAVWQSLQDEVDGDSLLLVTQIDKLRSERDRDRVLARIRKETRGLFREVYPISLLRAEAASDDKDAWQSSGAGAVVERLVEMLLTPATPPARRAQADAPALPPETAAPVPSAQDQRVIPRRITRPANAARRHERPVAGPAARQEHGI